MTLYTRSSLVTFGATAMITAVQSPVLSRFCGFSELVESPCIFAYMTDYYLFF